MCESQCILQTSAGGNTGRCRVFKSGSFKRVGEPVWSMMVRIGVVADNTGMQGKEATKMKRTLWTSDISPGSAQVEKSPQVQVTTAMSTWQTPFLVNQESEPLHFGFHSL